MIRNEDQQRDAYIENLYAEESYDKDYEELVKRFKKESNKNERCWPIYSFGWKDADLDPEGCTGIKKITTINDKYVELEIGGHKTLCDPTYEFEFELSEMDEEAYSESAFSIVCDIDYEGYWSGDDWSVYFTDVIRVEWVGFDDELIPKYDEMVEKIKEVAWENIKPFSEQTSDASKAMSELYQELYNKYDK
jgi:hypothetical protein